MRIMRRGLGLSALVAAGLILSNGVLRANDRPVVHVKAVVKDGAVRLEAQANGAIRIHHVSSERESLCARSERCVGGRSGRCARRCLRTGEELSRWFRTRRRISPWFASKYCSAQGVEPQVGARTIRRISILLVSRDAAAIAAAARLRCDASLSVTRTSAKRATIPESAVATRSNPFSK